MIALSTKALALIVMISLGTATAGITYQTGLQETRTLDSVTPWHESETTVWQRPTSLLSIYGGAIHTGTYVDWYVWDADAQTCYQKYKTSVDAFFDFADKIVQKYNSMFGLQYPGKMTLIVTAGTSSSDNANCADSGGSSGGTQITVGISNFYQGDRSYGYIILAHEAFNNWYGNVVGGGWPCDWWADGASPFPYMVASLAMIDLNYQVSISGAVSSAVAGQRHLDEKKSDPLVYQFFFQHIYQQLGNNQIAIFARLFGAMRSDGFTPAPIKDDWLSPGTYGYDKTEYILAYLSGVAASGQFINQGSAARAVGIGSARQLSGSPCKADGNYPAYPVDDSVIAAIWQRRMDLQSVSKSDPRWLAFLAGDYKSIGGKALTVKACLDLGDISCSDLGASVKITYVDTAGASQTKTITTPQTVQVQIGSQYTVDFQSKSGYTFSYWNKWGAVTGLDNPFVGPADNDWTLIAELKQSAPQTPQISVTPTSIPLGGTITVTGTGFTPTRSVTVSVSATGGFYGGGSTTATASGTISVQLTLDSVTYPTGAHQVYATDFGYDWVAVKSNTVTITIGSSPPPTGSYQFTVTAGSGGTVSGSQTGTYLSGASISVTASPSSGYQFADWSISGASCASGASSSPCTFTMPSNAVSLAATFSGGTGIPQITASSTSVTQGGSLTISGSGFTHSGLGAYYYVWKDWGASGQALIGYPSVSTSGTFTFVVGVDSSWSVGQHTVMASETFKGNSNQIAITVSSGGGGTYTISITTATDGSFSGGSITISGYGTYSLGQTLQLNAGSYSVTANPPSGKQFWTWTPAGLVSYGNQNSASTTATITGPATLYANFNTPVSTTIVASFAYKSAGQPNWVSVSQGSSIKVVSPVQFKVQITQGTVYGVRIVVDGSPYAMAISGSNLYLVTLNLSSVSHALSFQYQSSSGGSWGSLALLDAQSQQSGLQGGVSVIADALSTNLLAVGGLLLILLVSAIMVVWKRRR